MTALTDLRDHARTKATDRGTTPAEAALWTQIADEIEEYLNPPEPEPTLFQP
jgi:hypothetical protein